MKTAVVGGGAAGFFLAINLKERVPDMQVTIFERHQKVLSKVEISGGGRCNCTNSFAAVNGDLSSVYPRGHRLMKRLMKGFSQEDAFAWFENRGVRLVTQPDECVFPASQDSHTIISLFLNEARRLGIELRTGEPVTSIGQLADYDFIAITAGGQPREKGLQWLAELGHTIESPVPSLFTLRIDDPQLHELMGTVAGNATTFIPGTRLRADGPLLITHWGMSGPAILKLSSYAARLLAQSGYRQSIAVNWTGLHTTEIMEKLSATVSQQPQKLIQSLHPFELSSRLWTYLSEKSLGQRAHAPWGSLNQKELNRLLNTLSNDTFTTAGRAPFKDEFVTCGGISLASVNPSTLESRHVPHLYFAGEVLDIDGVTGGFNFQAAWTTAYTVATAIEKTMMLSSCATSSH